MLAGALQVMLLMFCMLACFRLACCAHFSSLLL
jgi:hypothetical protein